jgi:hypothetical protein
MPKYTLILLAIITVLVILLVAIISPNLMIYTVGVLTLGMCAAAMGKCRHGDRYSGGSAFRQYKAKSKTFSPTSQEKLEEHIKKYNLIKFEGDYYTQAEIDEIQKVYSEMHPISRVVTLMKDLPVNIPYRPLSLNRTLKIHNGQRKLLLSEVDFLTDFAKEGDTIVYAGAAPGIHTTFLARLFEPMKLCWHLYDPRDFIVKDLEFPGGGYIKTFTQYFEEVDAKKYAGRDDVLFITDIRTFDGVEMPSEDFVDNDMEMQETWVKEMKPKASMLKFRLRYNKVADIDETPYLDGEIRLQAWAPTASTETRLIVTDIKEKKYSISEYDAKMAYYNGIIREWMSYDNGIPNTLVRGIDTCADCALETIIWRKFAGRFMEGYSSMTSDEKNVAVADLFNRATKELGRGLFEPPHGKHPGVLKKDIRNEDAIYLHHATKIKAPISVQTKAAAQIDDV